MPVIALQSHDLHRDRPHFGHSTSNYLPGEVVQTPTTFTSSQEDHAASLPTPTSPDVSAQPQWKQAPAELHLDDDEPEAGPSGHRPVPPPPERRRHRSGVLMSRVRANSGAGGSALRQGLAMSSSKSYGDLSKVGEEDQDDPMTGSERFANAESRAGSRVTSFGSGLESDHEEMPWDNSARFYHHMHSRPVSRAHSRSTSPDRSSRYSPHSPTVDTLSPASSPSHARRTFSLPPQANQFSAGLSPNHGFLQQYLPPIFPGHATSPNSPEAELKEDPMGVPRMILTPTTQEWRELKGRVDGVNVGPSDDSGSSSEGEGPSEDGASGRVISHEPSVSPSKGILFGGAKFEKALERGFDSERPGLRRLVSADVLLKEDSHSPDPGSPEEDGVDGAFSDPEQRGTPQKPIFVPNIIAPSPQAAEESVVPAHPATPEHIEVITDPDRLTPPNEVLGSNRDAESTTADDSPVRFASIGRSESLRVIKKAGGTDEPPPLRRAKTKRELERERLFKNLDDELAADQAGQANSGPGGAWGRGIMEIGLGGGPESQSQSQSQSRSASAEGQRLDRDRDPAPAAPAVSQLSVPAPEPIARPTMPPKSATMPATPVLSRSLSPTVPMRPSPLQASPLRAPEMGTTLSSGSEQSVQSSIASVPGTSRPASPPSSSNLDTIRNFARKIASPHANVHGHTSHAHSHQITVTSDESPPRTPHRARDKSRISLVAGRVVQPLTLSAVQGLPERPPMVKQGSLGSFSAFVRSPQLTSVRTPSSLGQGSPQFPSLPPPFHRGDSTLSFAPSTAAPSEAGTPFSESVGGLGVRGIEDYVILKEAGQGAYGLVVRAKVKGLNGEPVGEEVIIKYIIKTRILADCWKKHKSLGPIPVEIHVMDQLRHLLYNPPAKPHPWDPTRFRPDAVSEVGQNDRLSDAAPATPPSRHPSRMQTSAPNTPVSETGSDGSASSMFAPTQKYIASEIKSAPQRGHPNIAKLLDFFEDREYYYLVMPRFGSGVDLFDRVELSPAGLEPFEVRSILGQLADALRFLHANGIVHRDIKDENVILDGEGRVQLIDFGSAAHWRPGKRWDTFSGTIHYASPEILRGDMYSGKEQDIWAFGVVAYVLLLGETPFEHLPDEVIEGLAGGTKAHEALYARCESTDDARHAGLEEDGGGRLEDAADLVRQCLQKEVGDRPSAEALLRHRYLMGGSGWTGKKGWVKLGLK